MPVSITTVSDPSSGWNEENPCLMTMWLCRPPGSSTTEKCPPAYRHTKIASSGDEYSAILTGAEFCSNHVRNPAAGPPFVLWSTRGGIVPIVNNGTHLSLMKLSYAIPSL